MSTEWVPSAFMGVFLQRIFDTSLSQRRGVGYQSIITTLALLLLRGKYLVLRDVFPTPPGERDVSSHIRHVVSIVERIYKG
jgi:hypothetical protein